jgi:MFS family permease
MHEEAGLQESQAAIAYLPVLLLAFIAMVPFIIIAEKRRKIKSIFLGSIATMGIAELGWAVLPDSLSLILFSLFLFFTAFNIMEASLPSMMSKLSPLENKGTAMGVYSTAQFVGAFLGGVLGGYIYGHFGLQGVFLVGAGLSVIWFLLILPMQAPRHLSSKIIHIESLSEANADEFVSRLHAVTGVVEAIVVVEEKVAYVKYTPEQINLDELASFGQQP